MRTIALQSGVRKWWEYLKAHKGPDFGYSVMYCPKPAKTILIIKLKR